MTGFDREEKNWSPKDAQGANLWWENVPLNKWSQWLIRVSNLRLNNFQNHQEVQEIIQQAIRWEAPLIKISDLEKRLAKDPGFTSKVIDDLLFHPGTRLVVYGTLAPGKCNHWVVADLVGQWYPAQVCGRLTYTGIIPYLTWSFHAPELDVLVFHSPELPDHWNRIDDFEGPCYLRVLIPARINGRLWPCFVYHWESTWPPEDSGVET